MTTKKMAIIATKGTLDMAYPPFILASTAAGADAGDGADAARHGIHGHDDDETKAQEAWRGLAARVARPVSGSRGEIHRLPDDGRSVRIRQERIHRAMRIRRGGGVHGIR